MDKQVAEICSKCSFEMYEVEKKYLIEMADKYNMAMHNIDSDWRSKDQKWFKVCPRCSSYELGIDFKKGFPIRNKQGVMTTIQHLGDIWNQ